MSGLSVPLRRARQSYWQCRACKDRACQCLAAMMTTSYCSIPQKPQGNLAGTAPWAAHSDLRDFAQRPNPNMPSQQNSVGLLDQAEVGSAGCSRDSSLLAAAKHSAAVALLVVSMSDRFGFSDLAASVAELQPMPCIVIATKVDAVQSWAMTLVGPYLQYAAGCMMLVPELTLCDTVKADVNRMAKEQNLPVYLMGVTSAGSSGTIDCQAKLGIHPTMDCVQTAVMSQILSSANAGLW